LYPYINLPETKTNYDKPFENKSNYQPKTYALIDINTADTATLNRLPGIGNVLSARIVAFRDKLGGFYSLEQLSEVYGLKPEVLEKIKLKLKPEISIQKYVFVNTASALELSQHPYIKKKLADIIVNYRTQHGNFRTIEDLRNIKVIDEVNFNKIKNYLKL
jgi:competence protein ComEA